MSHSEKPADERLPLYQRLRDDMLAKITAGEWQPGIAIPTEAELTRHYGVAIGTLRKAIDTLVNDGLMKRSQGRGTFIRRPEFDGSLFRFFRQLDAQGDRRVPGSRILFRTLEPAEPDVAKALALPTSSEVVCLKRVRDLDGQSVYLEEIWLPASRFKTLMSIELEDFGNLLYPFYEEQCGQLVGSASETLTVELASADAALTLDIGEGQPVVMIERIARGYDGIPLEFRRSCGSAATFRYQVDIS